MIQASLADRVRGRISLQLTVFLVILWLALTGLEDWFFGLIAITLSLTASGWLAPMQLTRFSLPGLLRYLLFFFHQSLAGGVDVAWRILHPRLPLAIHDCHYRLSLPAGQARTVFIGTVSLLPGTLSRDLLGDTLRVHSIAGDPARNLERLEHRVTDLFGLARGGCG